MRPPPLLAARHSPASPDTPTAEVGHRSTSSAERPVPEPPLVLGAVCPEQVVSVPRRYLSVCVGTRSRARRQRPLPALPQPVAASAATVGCATSAVSGALRLGRGQAHGGRA